MTSIRCGHMWLLSPEDVKAVKQQLILIQLTYTYIIKMFSSETARCESVILDLLKNLEFQPFPSVQ